MKAVGQGGLSEEWRPSGNPWVIAASVMLATFMVVLDSSVANVALPHIAGNLSATTEESTWVLTSYLVSNAIILPVTGWLALRFGRKRMLLASIVLFTTASLVCGAATSLGMLIVARVAQGIGGGGMQPIAQAVLLESFPPQKRGVAMAAFGMGVVVAPIVGPTLGGWITDSYSWRWIFYINLPIGLAALTMAKSFIEDPPYIRDAPRSRVDYVGFGLMAVWLATLQLILDKGQEVDWFASLWIRWFALVSVLAMGCFVVRELTTRHPIVNLRIFSNRNFAVGTALTSAYGVILYGVTPCAAMQTLMRYSALQSGLAVSPRGIGAMISMIVIGRLVGIFDNRLLLVMGFGILGLSCWMLGSVNLSISMGSVVWPNVINGLAAGFIFVPLTTTAMGRLRQEQIGNATGIYNLMRNIGGSFGLAVVTTMVGRGAQAHQATMVQHLTPYTAAYQQMLSRLSHPLPPADGVYVAGQRAIGIIYQTLLQQAAVFLYRQFPQPGNGCAVVYAAGNAVQQAQPGTRQARENKRVLAVVADSGAARPISLRRSSNMEKRYPVTRWPLPASVKVEENFLLR